jgi:hypothetical protein
MIEEGIGILVRGEQLFELRPQLRLILASLIQKGFALRRRHFNGGGE